MRIYFINIIVGKYKINNNYVFSLLSVKLSCYQFIQISQLFCLRIENEEKKFYLKQTFQKCKQFLSIFSILIIDKSCGL